MPYIDHEKSQMSDTDFILFQKLLLDHTGLYYEKRRKHQVVSGLVERMTHREIDSFGAYYHFLKHHPEAPHEIQDLIDELTIQETSFFRNKPQFDVLKSLVIPEIIQKQQTEGKSIRVWSAGCSTGQEIYSIAIFLSELLPEFKSWNISLLATDISRRALESVKRGIYHKKFMQSIPEHYRIKYFKERGNEVEISDQMRKMVKVERHNLAVDSFNHSQMKYLDIIFCKNVTIYFNQETTQRIMNEYYRSLKEGGYLFLGHSETLWKISDLFQTLEFSDTFLYRKGGGLVLPSDRMSLSEKPASDPAAQKSGNGHSLMSTQRIRKMSQGSPIVLEEDRLAFAQALELSQFKKYEAAISILIQFKSESPYFDQAKVAHARILSNQGKYEEAMSMLKTILEKDSLLEDAYYLMGILKNRTGDCEGALKMFQRTLYVNSGNILATFYLGEVYRQMNQIALARKTYQNTLKLLEHLPEGPTDFSEKFPPDLLSQTCLKKLKQLEAL